MNLNTQTEMPPLSIAPPPRKLLWPADYQKKWPKIFTPSKCHKMRTDGAFNAAGKALTWYQFGKSFCLYEDEVEAWIKAAGSLEPLSCPKDLEGSTQ